MVRGEAGWEDDQETLSAGSPEIKFLSDNDHRVWQDGGFWENLMKAVQWNGGDGSPAGEGVRETGHLVDTTLEFCCKMSRKMEGHVEWRNSPYLLLLSFTRLRHIDMLFSSCVNLGE